MALSFITLLAFTLAATSPAFGNPNLCGHGVGYNPYPDDCTLFVQCQVNAQGEPGVGSIRSCAIGLYWNQDKLTCDYKENVNCVLDVCKYGNQNQPSAASCQRYWDCSYGTPVAKCCPKGQGFDPSTHSCSASVYCHGDCTDPTTVQVSDCNGFRADPNGDETKYQVLTGPDTWVTMPCAPGTAFTSNPCGCNKRVEVYQQSCPAQLFYLIDNDKEDTGVWVQNEGVTVYNSQAYFNGYSKLVIPRFSNAWFGPKVYVYLAFKLDSLPYGQSQCLLVNGDTTSPSISITATPDGVEFYADTENANPVHFTVDYEGNPTTNWQYVKYALDNNYLTGEVNDNTNKVYATGNLETRQCDLVVGSGTGCANFEGLIDYIVIHFCNPFP